MEVIGENITKEIQIEDETITIKKFSVGDQKEIVKFKDNDIEVGIEGILRSVVKWSFKNTAGQPLFINRENILKLRVDLILTLSAEIMRFNLPIKLKKE